MGGARSSRGSGWIDLCEDEKREFSEVPSSFALPVTSTRGERSTTYFLSVQRGLEIESGSIR